MVRVNPTPTPNPNRLQARLPLARGLELVLGGRQVRLEKPLGRRQRRHLLRLPLELLREQPRVISPRAQLGLRGVPLLLQRGQLRLGRLAPALRLVEPRLERARLVARRAMVGGAMVGRAMVSRAWVRHPSRRANPNPNPNPKAFPQP